MKVFKGLYENGRFCSKWITTWSPGEIVIITPSSINLQPSLRDLESTLSVGKNPPSAYWTFEIIASVFMSKLPGTSQLESGLSDNSNLIVELDDSIKIFELEILW